MFSVAHADTPRQWKPTAAVAKSPGSPRKMPFEVVQRLATVITTFTLASPPLGGPFRHHLIFERETAAALSGTHCRFPSGYAGIDFCFLAAVVGTRQDRRALGVRPRLYPAARRCRRRLFLRVTRCPAATWYRCSVRPVSSVSHSISAPCPDSRAPKNTTVPKSPSFALTWRASSMQVQPRWRRVGITLRAGGTSFRRAKRSQVLQQRCVRSIRDGRREREWRTHFCKVYGNRPVSELII